MMKRLLKYELGRLILPFGILYALSLLLSLSIRLAGGGEGGSLAGILFTFLLTLGSAGILVWRFYQTLYGHEAVFLFSVPTGAAAQIAFRVLSALVFSVLSGFVMMVSSLLIGGEPSRLTLSLTPLSAAVYLGGMVLSILGLTLELELFLTLSGLPVFRPRQKRWISAFFVLSFAADRFISPAMDRLWPMQLILTSDGLFFSGDRIPADFSLSFSLAGVLLSLIRIPVCILLIIFLIRKYVMIAE